MKPVKLIIYTCLVVLVGFLSACSASEENAGSSNTNATPPGNNNAASQPLIAQSNTPNAPPAVKPAPTLPSVGQPPAAANANVSFDPAPVNKPGAPKLMVSSKKIDFGKQPQDKTLVRAIVVRNGGREDLKIESVVPS